MEVLNKDTFKLKVFDFEAAKEWSFKGARPVIVDFYADWCAPCRALGPVLEQVAQKYSGKIDIYKVDTQATPELASMFGVRGIPAILFIPLEGQPAMTSGFMAEDAFDEAIEEIFDIQGE